MSDPLLDAYRELRCPEGSRPEMMIDEDRVGCFTRDGAEVEPLAAESGIGVVGWSAIISGFVAVAAELYRRRG